MKRKIALLILISLMLLTLTSCEISWSDILEFPFELPSFKKPCNHVWEIATCTTPAICLICNETDGHALGHTWLPATCTSPITCFSCYKTIGDPIAHTAGVPATCTNPQRCTECDKILAEALGHEVVVDESKEATCTEPGLTEGKHCSVCQAVLVPQQEIPTIEHTYVDGTCACGEKEPQA